MVKINIKISAFEYLVDHFIEWGTEEGIEDTQTDFTKLKLIKLLFFASAVNADEETPGLLSTFDKFYAMPLGHVESYVYDNLGECKRYSITRSGYTISDTPIDRKEIDTLLPDLDRAIDSLKQVNRKLITYSASQLVELSHQWYSWKASFQLARSLGKYSIEIDMKLIQKEVKYFR